MSDPISVVSLLCEEMSEQGKDVKSEMNHQDEFGQTPLHRAALRGSTICALNLLQVTDHPPVILKGATSPYFESFSATCKIIFSVRETTKY